MHAAAIGILGIIHLDFVENDVARGFYLQGCESGSLDIVVRVCIEDHILYCYRSHPVGDMQEISVETVEIGVRIDGVQSRRASNTVPTTLDGQAESRGCRPARRAVDLGAGVYCSAVFHPDDAIAGGHKATHQ